MTVAAEPVLRGSRVALRVATHDDAPHFVRWASDADFAWYQWARDPGRFPDDAAARAFIDSPRLEPPTGRLFVIEHARAPIGFANYRDLVPKARSAEIGIGIGEKALWSQGLGREALGLLLRHLTEDLGLHRVTLSVVSYNDRAIASYKAAGFEIEGIERDAVMTDRGTYVDDVKMAYLAGRDRPAFDPRPVTLEGAHVRLVPLRMEHAEALFAAGDEDDIWHHVQPRPEGSEGYARYIRWALDQQTLGAQIPFAVIREADGELVGTTRYAHIDRANHTLEIGYTFYGKGSRRTATNTECKLLLLTHAFDTLGAKRVWLQTDKRNERSQAAIARLGAIKEGELRNERILPDGRLRTSVVFAVTSEDWPPVKARLQGFLR
ncbi:MAG: GNAT family N-acetyltransferase [Chloroflexi bacterium]|nr:MAG: GNAT family N-acetyltransferase [Chloroflexota bacterium]